MATSIRIVHTETGTVIAEGLKGWGMTPFEGNYYIARRYLRASFKPNFVPGLCIYKFLYIWMDLVLLDGRRERSLGWFRVAVSANDPALTVTEPSTTSSAIARSSSNQ